MADFVALAAVAKRLIDANGRSVTLIKQGTTPQDADQPWRGQANYPQAQVTGIAAFVPATQLLTWKVDWDGFKKGVNYFLFPASDDGGHQLEYFDQLVDGDIHWRIIHVEVVGPAATRVVYMIEVAR